MIIKQSDLRLSRPTSTDISIYGQTSANCVEKFVDLRQILKNISTHTDLPDGQTNACNTKCTMNKARKTFLQVKNKMTRRSLQRQFALKTQRVTLVKDLCKALLQLWLKIVHQRKGIKVLPPMTLPQKDAKEMIRPATKQMGRKGMANKHWQSLTIRLRRDELK